MKRLEEGEDAWREEQLKRYTDNANRACVMDRLQMQREYESRLQAMRDRCGPRIDARASVQENVAASLHEARHSLRFVRAHVARLEVVIEDHAEVERECDAFNGMVDDL